MANESVKFIVCEQNKHKKEIMIYFVLIIFTEGAHFL